MLVTTDLAARDVQTSARAQIPTVVIDPVHSLSPAVTCNGATNSAGGHAAAPHLIGLVTAARSEVSTSTVRPHLVLSHARSRRPAA